VLHNWAAKVSRLLKNLEFARIIVKLKLKTFKTVKQIRHCFLYFTAIILFFLFYALSFHCTKSYHIFGEKKGKGQSDF